MARKKSIKASSSEPIRRMPPAITPEAKENQMISLSMDLAEKPLTIIYDNVRHMAPELIAEDGSAGIRVTREEFSQELCRRMGGAVVSTSANISGQPSPANFSEISAEIRAGVDYIVEYRQTEQTRSVASGIIKLGSGGLVKVIRE